MDDDKTDLMVYNALTKGGFRAVDTANHYRNHKGVARGIKSAYRDGYKVPMIEISSLLRLVPCAAELMYRGKHGVVSNTCTTHHKPYL